MDEAFTVRIRSTGGRPSFYLAPAGGMGLSQPCCSDGHDSREDALACGFQVLAQRLNPVPRTAVA